MKDNKQRFAKLMSALGGKKPLANPGIDKELDNGNKKEAQLQMIDAKIAELEESDDPNALESLNFWKQRRMKLAGE